MKNKNNKKRYLFTNILFIFKVNKLLQYFLQFTKMSLLNLKTIRTKNKKRKTSNLIKTASNRFNVRDSFFLFEPQRNGKLILSAYHKFTKKR